MLLFTVFSLHPPSTPLPSHQNEGLISEKHLNTTCPQTELTVWRHAHEDESTHTHRGEAPMQRSGSRLQDQRRKHRSKPRRTITASTARRNNGQNETRTMPSHQSTLFPSANKTDPVITVSGQRGSADPAGADVKDAALISALNYKRTQALLQTPPCWHSQSFSTTAFLHSLTATLWETADRGKENTNSTVDSLRTSIYAVALPRDNWGCKS